MRPAYNLLGHAGHCPLPDIQHGYVITDIYGGADMVTHGQHIFYSCNKGFVNGTEVPRCVNGSWTAEAICTPGMCQTPSERQTDKETPRFVRFAFVRCVCQERPSYKANEARCFIKIYVRGEIKYPESTDSAFHPPGVGK